MSHAKQKMYIILSIFVFQYKYPNILKSKCLLEMQIKDIKSFLKNLAKVSEFMLKTGTNICQCDIKTCFFFK